MTAPDNNIQTFSSLAEIRAQKEKLQKEIYDSEDKIVTLWNDIFHKKEPQEPMTPVQRISGMINIGAGVIDGLILGWKIYRKFKGTRPLFKWKKRY